MNTPKLLSMTSLVAGLMIFTAPTLAAHHEGSPASPPQAGYGHDCRGMPGYGSYGYQRPAMPPYGYPRPMYGPPHPRPHAYMMPPRRPYAMGYPAVRQPAAPAAATAQPAASTAAVASDAAADEAAITISQMQFSPARVTVKKGATVTWTQRDNMPHTVTASNGSFGSQTLNGGASDSRTFDEPGEYSYYCSLHPSMQGEIVVTE